MSFSKDLLVFDFETTGLSAQKNDAIQIAASRIDKDTLEEIAHYETFISPERFDIGDPSTYDLKALKVTGYSKEQINELKINAPTIYDIIPEFETAIFGQSTLKKGFYGKEVLLCGQNVAFDMGFLKDILARNSLSPDRYGYHTVDVANLCFFARTFFGFETEKGSNSLDAQIQAFGLKRGSHHDAREDVLLTVELVRKYTSIFNKIQEDLGYNAFAQDSSKNIHLPKSGF